MNCPDCDWELEREDLVDWDKKHWLANYFCLNCKGEWLYGWGGLRRRGISELTQLDRYLLGDYDENGQVW